MAFKAKSSCYVIETAQYVSGGSENALRKEILSNLQVFLGIKGCEVRVSVLIKNLGCRTGSLVLSKGAVSATVGGKIRKAECFFFVLRHTVR